MWYDYSFRPQGVSEELAALKQTDHGRWNDLVFVKMPYDDKRFLELEIERLEAQLGRVKDHDTIVSGTHFLPFRECVTSIGRERSSSGITTTRSWAPRALENCSRATASNTRSMAIRTPRKSKSSGLSTCRESRP